MTRVSSQGFSRLHLKWSNRRVMLVFMQPDAGNMLLYRVNSIDVKELLYIQSLFSTFSPCNPRGVSRFHPLWSGPAPFWALS